MLLLNTENPRGPNSEYHVDGLVTQRAKASADGFILTNVRMNVINAKINNWVIKRIINEP